jgi:hypothetical protein
MYNYHKTHHKSSYICECENRSLLRKGSPEGQKSVLTELDRATPVNLPKRLSGVVRADDIRMGKRRVSPSLCAAKLARLHRFRVLLFSL